MKIAFSKAVASGNDFVIVENRKNILTAEVKNFGKLARFLCERKYSVGADGLLMLEDSAAADFRMRIFNPDGSEVEMCGNGIRCSAIYAFLKKWCGQSAKIETKAGILRAEISAGSVKIKMTDPEDIILNHKIGITKTIINLHTINTGVPHAVHFVDSLKDYPVTEIGAKIRFHKTFEPEGINADFVEFIDKSSISVRTYERGVEAETLACGTGAVASAVIAHLVKGAESPVKVNTLSGDVLKVHFKKELKHFKEVYLEGKACIVFEGGINYV